MVNSSVTLLYIHKLNYQLSSTSRDTRLCRAVFFDLCLKKEACGRCGPKSMEVEKTAVSVWLEGLHLPEYKQAFLSSGYVNMSDLTKVSKEDVSVSTRALACVHC